MPTGMPRITFDVQEMIESVIPPKYPARDPATSAMTKESTAVYTPTSSEVRAPCTMFDQ